VPRFDINNEFVGFISACIEIDDQKRFREKIQDSELLFKTISNASPERKRNFARSMISLRATRRSRSSARYHGET
jgi:hypothetical protein